MKELLRNLITVNTFKGSDKFYFKNAPVVGTVNGKEAYCVFYYSHYDEYMVYALAWKGDGFDFHYLNENEMTPTHEFHFQTLDDSGKFVPATDIINILPNYLEVIYNATQEQENIEYNAKFTALYDRQRKLQYYFKNVREEVEGYNPYDEATYLDEYPMRLELNEYHLLHERYVNLKPDLKREAELAKHKSYTKEQILSEMAKDKKQSESMRRILDGLFKKEKTK
jgi:predicted NodU family carbamoyl transferase